MYDGLSKTQALILLKDSTLIDTFFRVISSLDLNITQINLDFIPFDSIPSSIGRINKVKILNLRSCKLKGIPPSIGNLPQLNHIELSNNPAMNFDSTFRILGKCDSLKVLHLSNNKLYSLPCSICLLQRLVYLTIDKDSLSVLPDCFKGLNNLKWLDISDNQFQHLPILLYDMKNLGVIEGTGNKFSTAEKEKIFNYPNRKFGYRL
jgi:Leucine-rich repeat (LRR) protein